MNKPKPLVFTRDQFILDPNKVVLGLLFCCKCAIACMPYPILILPWLFHLNPFRAVASVIHGLLVAAPQSFWIAALAKPLRQRRFSRSLGSCSLSQFQSTPCRPLFRHRSFL